MKLFFSLVGTFIMFTIIGTITHELGHYAAAKYIGLKPNLHFNYVDYELSNNDIELDKINGLYQKEIEAKQDFPAKKRFEEIMAIEIENNIITRACGPLQTMLTGTIGFILLIVYRKYFFASTSLNVRQWLLVFFSLFWLRQVLNFTIAFVTMLTTGTKEFNGDEFVLAQHLGMPNFSIQFITAIIGIFVSFIVVFKFIPSLQRKLFIAAGLIGGAAGYVLWMYILGPRLMP